MRRFTTLLALSVGLLAAAACTGGAATDPTPTPTATGTALVDPTGEARDVTFSELFSNPDQYKGGDIRLEGFYFDGFETTVLSERLEYTGQAEGHLWPRGQMVWIEGNLIPPQIYSQLYEQQMIGPTERYGKLRIKGRFDYGARYGHVGGFAAQIVPSEVQLLQWSPPPTPTATPTLSVVREWTLEGIQVDGSTVTARLHVFAGIDVRVTLDGRSSDELNALVPNLEFVFKNVAPGSHTIEVNDVVGFTETTKVVVPTSDAAEDQQTS